MKTTLITFFLICSTLFVYSQWEEVSIPGSTAPVTSMFTYLDTLMAGTDGDGIFTTKDYGATWIDISGNIGNKYINDMRGGASPTAIWVSTDNGPFYTEDHANYDDNTSTGLTNTDINYYWFGGDNGTNAEWAIGTNGGGVFTSSELTGPWIEANTGISGDGLFINDMGGYSDGSVDYAVAGTIGGVYYSSDNLGSWTAKNNGLSGNSLIVNSLTGLGSVVYIATDGGYLFSYDLGESWIPLIQNEKFNITRAFPAGAGFFFFLFGETGYYSVDGQNFIPIDMSGITGEVISFAANSTLVFIGTQTTDKDGKLSGSVYKRPIDQITSVEDHLFTGTKTDYLKQNFPNPFNSSTTISYDLPQSDFVTLKIFNLLGEEVCTLVNEFQKTGHHSIDFTPENINGNIFFYHLQTGNGLAETKKMSMLD
ncbi:MAG: T9SS type A sorting domain-containing protein [Bacteroidales bacterium]|nr:T9SS type A sorting domain-containing protein [Bacteroidales bacterium]